MTAVCERSLAALVIICAAASVGVAQAPSSAADEAFRSGRELLKAGKYAEACEQFAKSQRLDPAHGTLFNIAACSEQIGKLATAVAAYRELVAKDTNDQRKATAGERLKALAWRVPKLVVKLDNPPPGLVVELDSEAGPRKGEANKPMEVDFGEYTVMVRARDYNEFMARVKINQEAKTTIVEAKLVLGASNVDAALEQEGEASASRSNRKLIGMVGVGVGGASMITGIVFGSLARGKWNDAKAVCGGMTCANQADLDRANGLADQARSHATLSTVLTLAGAAIVAGGVVLWVTAPGETQIAPTASDSGAGVTFSGRF